MTTSTTTLDSILSKRQIIVTCGTGGVGKTTLSAAMAIRATLLGKKTVVITIDPAKRLAQSLGLKSLSNEPTDLTDLLQKTLQSAQAKAPLTLPSQLNLSTGTLSALVPDTRLTFENFVRELSPTPNLAERVINNPIFQIFAKELSGANEYMALECLLSVYKKDQFDCIILDTPPSRNTLAFLNAPNVLSQFFEEKLIRWLVLPSNQLLSTGMKKTFQILERLTGAGFITHLFEFAAALFEVRVKFASNLSVIMNLLKSDKVGFMMVTAPTPETEQELNLFLSGLSERKFHFDGLLLNRTLQYLESSQSPPPNSKKWKEAHTLINAILKREEQVFKNLMKHPIPVCAKLPELARDIHSLEDLLHVALVLNMPNPFTQ